MRRQQKQNQRQSQQEELDIPLEDINHLLPNCLKEVIYGTTDLVPNRQHSELSNTIARLDTIAPPASSQQQLQVKTRADDGHARQYPSYSSIVGSNRPLYSSQVSGANTPFQSPAHSLVPSTASPQLLADETIASSSSSSAVQSPLTRRRQTIGQPLANTAAALTHHTQPIARTNEQQLTQQAAAAGINRKRAKTLDLSGTVLVGPDREYRKMNLFKTEMCRSFEETGQCKYGDLCHFAHRESELRQVKRHPRYKTEICKTFWEKGSCPYGKRCCFIHHFKDESGAKGDSDGRSRSSSGGSCDGKQSRLFKLGIL